MTALKQLKSGIRRSGIAQILAWLLVPAFSVTTGWSQEPSGKTKNVLLIRSDDLKARVLRASGNIEFVRKSQFPEEQAPSGEGTA